MDSTQKSLNPLEWSYLTEGSNHVIFQSKNEENDEILRVRKVGNKSYYSDPSLIPELEYNKLFIDNIILNNKILA